MLVAALSQTTSAGGFTAVGCADSPAPKLCTVKALHVHTNAWRSRLGQPKLALEQAVFGQPKKRPYFVWLWSVRKQRAKTAYARYQAAPWLHGAWYQAALCIHSHEGAWTAETGNGYHGGLQMDDSFERAYGPEWVAEYGHAGYWPPADQLHAAYRAWLTRGWSPWPNTAAACGLL